MQYRPRQGAEYPPVIRSKQLDYSENPWPMPGVMLHLRRTTLRRFARLASAGLYRLKAQAPGAAAY
jgi:hypothetical protein